jgi:hypothetical protein
MSDIDQTNLIRARQRSRARIMGVLLAVSSSSSSRFRS